MILAALNDYYQRLLLDEESGIAERGYRYEQISYVIVLKENGNIVDVLDWRQERKKKMEPKPLKTPLVERTSGIKSKFLWDNTSYVLGASEKSKRSDKEHDAFKSFHKSILKDSNDKGLVAFLAFLDTWNPSNFQASPLFTKHGSEFLDKNLVFKLEDENQFIHQRPAAMDIWAKSQEQAVDGGQGICLVTGEDARLVRLHPAIKGFVTTGSFIVSFNEESYTSYKGSLPTKTKGNNSSVNAPVSEQAAFAYTTALNHLLRRDDNNRQRLQIGDATVVFWAQADDSKKAQAAEDLFAEFFDPKDEDAQHTGRLEAALEKVRQGLPLSDLNADLQENTRIFVLGLAPNASRLSIRFWETGNLKVFAERLAAHYHDLQLEPSPWRTPPALWRLLLSTAPNRDGKAKSEDVPPQLAGELTRSILTGQRYPYSLLSTLIMRLRADGDERALGARAALIKAILIRARRLGQQIDNKGELPVSLDTKNTAPGYLLGRLFAVLENIQRAALGKEINATIRDRFYGSASATPASVFPVLVRNAQHHLSRLRKDKPGFAVNLEKDIADILDLLGTSFPKSLGLEAQGHFTIGYYHQTKARFASKDAPEENEETTDSKGENA